MQRLEQALGDLDRVLLRVGSAEILTEHGELVAPESRQRVTRPENAPQSLAHCDEELVTELVAEAVVVVLELVEIEEQHRGGVALPSGPRQREGQELEEQRSVGQTGERIVVGLELELLFRGLPFDRDRAEVDEVVDHRVVGSRRRARLGPVDREGAEHPPVGRRQDRGRPAGAKPVVGHQLSVRLEERILS